LRQLVVLQARLAGDLATGRFESVQPGLFEFIRYENVHMTLSRFYRGARLHFPNFEWLASPT
jgi:hypothetical protein